MSGNNPKNVKRGKRIAREKKTVSQMIAMFCSANHEGVELCEECSNLTAYAMCRLDKCPFGDGKPRCADCHIHCYKPEMRERIRQVMRYSGPRMLLRHPLLAVLHELPALRKIMRDVSVRSFIWL